MTKEELNDMAECINCWNFFNEGEEFTFGQLDYLSMTLKRQYPKLKRSDWIKKATQLPGNES